MKSKTRRYMSTLMALAMLFGLLCATPLTALAALVEITGHPQNQTVDVGETALFGVSATGDNLNYQWQCSTNGSTWNDLSDDTAFNGAVFGGSQESELLVYDAQQNQNGWRFRCVVFVILEFAQEGSTVTSNAATLTVGSTAQQHNVAPVITGPTELTLQEGYSATYVDGFVLTGGPAATWRVTPVDPRITWNVNSRRLIIAEGIPAGLTRVAFDAFDPDSGLEAERHWFTLYVSNAPVKSVLVEAQVGGLVSNASGAPPLLTHIATFNVITTAIDDCKVGSIAWFADASGTMPAARPPGIEASVSDVWENAAVVTMTADPALAVEGYYYFKVMIDGVISNIVQMRVTAAIQLFSTGMHNFVKVRTYIPGQFTDVNEDHWYGVNGGGYVAAVYEYGIMQGTSESTFNPTGHMFLAEVITVAARLHSIYNTGGAQFIQGAPWYQVYVDYAVRNGIIDLSIFDSDGSENRYHREATRAEIAYIFAHTFPASEYPVINTIVSIPDVSSDDPFYDSILMMYRAGILTGRTSDGTFYPNDPVMRVEVATIITRVIQQETRRLLDE